MYPHTASGVSLDNASALAGITPISAEKTTVVCTCYGTNGTQIPYGSQIASESNNNIVFQSVDANATISALSACDVGVTFTEVNAETYTITIDGTPHSYTADGTETIAQVLTALGSSITEVTASVENDVLNLSRLMFSYQMFGYVLCLQVDLISRLDPFCPPSLLHMPEWYHDLFYLPLPPPRHHTMAAQDTYLQLEYQL